LYREPLVLKASRYNPAQKRDHSKWRKRWVKSFSIQSRPKAGSLEVTRAVG